MTEALGGERPPIDLLRLFREDLNPEERIEAFGRATEIVADEINASLEGGLRDRINGRFNIKVVHNSHGDGIHAGQSLAMLNQPFITFVEGAGAPETVSDPSFATSVNNAFDMAFNDSQPLDSIFPLIPDRIWGYYRDHGLLKKGSIIAPVDIRSYAYRLLDALMGQDYSQDFLNRRISLEDLRSKTTEQLTEDAVNHGRLVMHSNALREHTTASQVVRTLNDLLVVEEGGTTYSTTLDERLRALMHKRELDGPKLEVGLFYGTAHHTFMHLLHSFGVEAEREFPSREEEKRPFAFTGSNLDAFFAGYLQDYSPERLDQLGRAYVLESLFATVLGLGNEFDCVPSSYSAARDAWKRISLVARKMSDSDSFNSVIGEFQSNKMSVVGVLRHAGVDLRDI